MLTLLTYHRVASVIVAMLLDLYVNIAHHLTTKKLNLEIP